MGKVFAIALAGSLAIATTGCFAHTYRFGKGGNVEKESTDVSWHSHWLFGSIGEKEVKIDQICPSWDATIRDRISFFNGVIILLNAGIIYAPSTVTVWCGEEGEPAEKADEDEDDEDDDEDDEDDDEDDEDY